MTSMVFALESGIFAVLGATWQSVLSLIVKPNLGDDYILYAQSFFALVHLFLMSLFLEKRTICRAYFTITFLIWLFAIVIGLESFYSLTIDTKNMPQITPNTTRLIQLSNKSICCPNYLYMQWNQYIYFNGFTYFAAPFAITFAFQTIHLIIAAAGLLHTQSSLYPGVSLAHGIFALALFILNIKFFNYFTPPCVSSNINLFNGFMIVNLRLVFAGLSLAFMLMAAAEESMISKRLKICWFLLTLVLIFISTAVIYLNLYGYNLISIPWLSLVGLAFIILFYSVTDIINPAIEEIQTEVKQRMKSRSRFVMPLQAIMTPSSKTAKHD